MRMMLSALGVLLLLSIWQIAAALVDSFFLPAPWHTIQDTFRLLGRWHTWQQIGITLVRVISAFALAFCCGTLMGMLIGSRKKLEILFKPTILIIQGIPPILWTIPLILILGAHPGTPILVIALICFPLVTITIAEGMTSVPQTLVDMLKIFAPGIRPQLKEIILPHLKPFFAASFSLGLMLGIKASVIAEFFGANNGIGFQIQAAYQSLLVHRLFAWGLLFVMLILLFDAALKRLEATSRRRRLRPVNPAPVSSGAPARETEALQRLFSARQPGSPIRMEQVAFHYTGHAEILTDVTLIVQSNDIAIISGDSGKGKTTLLHLIASLLTPTAGRIVHPQQVGFVFQDDRFLPWRTNVWNVALPLIYQGYGKHRALSFAGHLLKEVGLGGRETAYPEELSGGMKKRLAFARCFARLPGSILMDEPFAGLHKEARDMLWNKFFNLLRLHPVPVIIMTHFPEEIAPPPNGRFYSLEGSPATLRPLDRGFQK